MAREKEYRDSRLKEKMEQRKRNIQTIIKYAADLGIKSIYENHPTFRGPKELLSKHIEWEKLGHKAKEIYSDLSEHNIRGEKALDYVEKEIANYIASGKLFDKFAEDIILKKGMEEKPETGFWDYFQLPKFQEMFPFIKTKPKLDGAKYLDNTLKAARDADYLLKQRNLERKLPELEKNLETLEVMGYLDNFIDMQKYYGIIGPKNYKSYKKTINKILKKTSKRGERIVKRTLEEYLHASILGILGVGLIVVSSRITGAVVGVSNETISCIVGGCMIIGTLLLIFRLSKKKIKK